METTSTAYSKLSRASLRAVNEADCPAAQDFGFGDPGSCDSAGDADAESASPGQGGGPLYQLVLGSLRHFLTVTRLSSLYWL